MVVESHVWETSGGEVAKNSQTQAVVAQLVEHRIEDPIVGGAIPSHSNPSLKECSIRRADRLLKPVFRAVESVVD